MPEVIMPLIGGASVETNVSALEYRSPIDDAVLWKAVQSDGEIAEAAVRAAQAAYLANRRTTIASRAMWLEKAAEKILAGKEKLARVIVTSLGKPLRAALFEVSRTAEFIRLCAHEIAGMRGETLPLDSVAAGKGRYGQTKRVPLGVVLAITPFNAPANLLVQKIAPAIAAGNAVIVKPAPEGLQAAMMIAEIFASAGLPTGLLNVIPGGPESALALARHPGVSAVTLTGGNRAAEALAAAAGAKRFVAELGSNSAAIVCSDADIAVAANRLAASAFEASGQQCISAQRIFVDQSVFPKFVDLFVAASKLLKVGDPFDMATDVGPMVNARSADRVESMLRDAEAAGATIALSPRRDGCILSPAIVTNAPANCRLMTEEAFGPVVIVNPFVDVSGAIDAANATPYGLQASCFTKDLGTAYRMFEELDVGSVWINEGTRFRLDVYPFGGVKSSGYGREGVRYAIEEMSQWKFLGISLPAMS